MKLLFTKMHGAGNDFVIADNSRGLWNLSPEFIRFICDRHKGVGADGLILLNLDSNGQILMQYFNRDGSYAALCGNGLRCAASFAFQNGITPARQKKNTLRCGGLLYQTEICDDRGDLVKISLSMTEPFQKFNLENGERVYKGGVGVPHVIAVRQNLETMDVETEGKRLRNHSFFLPQGANADFLGFESPDQSKPVRIRTFERGVEAETLACGTGCASAGIVLHQFYSFPEKVSFLCQGNDHIEVEIWKDGSNLKGVFLTGPAKTAFRGEIFCNDTDLSKNH